MDLDAASECSSTTSSTSLQSLYAFDEHEVEDPADPQEPLAQSLFDEFVAENAETVWLHMKKQHSFDLEEFRRLCPNFDDYARIRLINYLRTEQNLGRTVNISELLTAPQIWNHEKYTLPPSNGIVNDRLLWELPLGFDLQSASDNDTDVEEEKRRQPREETSEDTRLLEAQITSLTRQVADLKAMLTDPVHVQQPHSQKHKATTAARASSPSDHDRYYFDSYSHLSIHREMIQDTIRTQAYRDFILKARDHFEGKVVLDVGCGSGILSMFCAQAGARRVIGIDAAAPTLEIARQIVAVNGFSDGHQIQLFNAQLEMSQLWFTDSNKETVVVTPRDAPPPSEAALPFQADILVSEWMGYALLYEAMLHTVIDARHRFLAPNGLLVPSRAQMQVWAADLDGALMEELYVWDKPLYGLDLQLLKPDEDAFLRTGWVMSVDASCLVSGPCTFLELDLSRVTSDALKSSLRQPFALQCTKPPTSLVLSFTCVFDAPCLQGAGLTLSTAPTQPTTHWKQTVCHLPACVRQQARSQVPPETPLQLEGHLSLTPGSDNARHLVVTLELNPMVIESNSQQQQPVSSPAFVVFELR